MIVAAVGEAQTGEIVRRTTVMSILRSTWRTMAPAIGPALLVWLVSGCELPPSHQERVEFRERKMEEGFRKFERIEEGRLDKMGHTLNRFEEIHQRDLVKTERNAGRIERWFDNEFENWERSVPVNERRFEELMRGDTENIDRSIPIILY